MQKSTISLCQKHSVTNVAVIAKHKIKYSTRISACEIVLASHNSHARANEDYGGIEPLWVTALHGKDQFSDIFYFITMGYDKTVQTSGMYIILFKFYGIKTLKYVYGSQHVPVDSGEDYRNMV